ncbi:MAG: hypothetical protein WStaBPW_12240 [Shewanella algae]
MGPAAAQFKLCKANKLNKGGLNRLFGFFESEMLRVLINSDQLMLSEHKKAPQLSAT